MKLFIKILFLALGAFLIILGIFLIKKHKIKIIHDYHYTNVKEDDIVPYTKAMGKGVILMGASVFVMPLSWILYEKAILGVILFVIGFLISIIMIFKAQKQFNGGIF